MILLDTGAILALLNRRDDVHRAAIACYDRLARETFAVHPLILAETWYLCESRVGTAAARAVTHSVARGELELLPVDREDLHAALRIERRYAARKLGLTDAVSLALCDRYRIRTVFTFDRTDFGVYRTPRGEPLTLVP